MVLSGIASQTALNRCSVIISDQSDQSVFESRVVQSLCRIIEAREATIRTHRRPVRKGIAEQRDFLLRQATAPYVLYLDDDVFLEPWVVEHLAETITDQQCGFVGAFPTGLSFRDDFRPEQQIIEYWEGSVRPEAVDPDSREWERAQLHRAANAYHVARTLPPGEVRLYRVAWVACCVLYDRQKLVEIGGFSFWPRLPRFHSGEEVLVQNLLMRRWGGCAILPSGAYHSELPSTVLNDRGTVDGHALSLLEEMIERFAPETRASRRTVSQ